MTMSTCTANQDRSACRPLQPLQEDTKMRGQLINERGERVGNWLTSSYYPDTRVVAFSTSGGEVTCSVKAGTPLRQAIVDLLDNTTSLIIHANDGEWIDGVQGRICRFLQDNNRLSMVAYPEDQHRSTRPADPNGRTV